MKLRLSSAGNPFRPKRQHFNVFSFIFLMIFGAVFVGAGYYMLESLKVDPPWSEVSGKVIDASPRVNDEGDRTFRSVVEYKVGERMYRVFGAVSSSTPPTTGEARKVAYNPERPAESKVTDEPTAVWMMYGAMAIGAFLIVLSPILYIRSLRRSRAIKKLMKYGQKAQGVLVDIQSSGGKNQTYKIVVAAPGSDGIAQHFISDSLMGIGGLSLSNYRDMPIPIDVFIDPADPENYYVDIADIPNLTSERIVELLQSVAKPQQSQQPRPMQGVQSPLGAPRDQPLTVPQNRPPAQSVTPQNRPPQPPVFR